MAEARKLSGVLGKMRGHMQEREAALAGVQQREKIVPEVRMLELIAVAASARYRLHVIHVVGVKLEIGSRVDGPDALNNGQELGARH
eukprot:7293808-Pyramimonas_sp.AAC.1